MSTKEKLHYAFSLFVRTLVLMVLATFCGAMILIAAKLGTMAGIWAATPTNSFLPGMSLFEKIVVVELGIVAGALVFRSS